MTAPAFWNRLIFLSAVGKTAVAGAGAGLALLGLFDVTFAITAREWWEIVRPDTLVNAFAIGGGVLGIVGRLVAMLVH